MPSRKFNIAFSSAATIPFRLLVVMIFRYGISTRYFIRALLALLLALVFAPFTWYERLRFDRQLARVELPKSPVFILGHWRSGTTLLHNAMCRDPQFAYVNTFQGVFNNQFFGSRWLFRPLMKLLMPEKRPADNVILNLDFPQEEGIALCNVNAFAFYLFFYFPHQWKLFYDKFIRCKDISRKQMENSQNRYRRLIAQAMLEYKRPNFISKSPPNTGLIPVLLEMFPDAKFVYIYRNPILVHKSTVRFFDATLVALTLQSYTFKDVDDMVFELSDALIRDYEQLKSQIPDHHLVEVRYEDFEQSPLEHLKTIYEKLNIEGFDLAQPAMAAYLDEQKRFEKATHQISPEESARIAARHAFAMKRYGYTS